MAGRGTGGAMRQVGRLWLGGAVAGRPDGQLLEQFVDRRGESAEAAFAELVERHGPMVLGVCRRALPDPRDAEDAFQATFLVLARKAGSVRVGDSLGRWLYGVSRRVSSRARAREGRRIALERELATARRPGEDMPSADRFDLGGVLDEELGRLPAKYRDPLVLCYLQGQTHEAAARQLGWSVGTVRGRMARARDLLRARLVRRGVAPYVAMLGVTVAAEARASVPAKLVDLAARSACRVAGARTLAGLASARVADLAGPELASMTMARWKGIAAAWLVAGAACAGVGLGGGPPIAARPPRPAPAPVPKAASPAPEDREGIVGTWTSDEPVQEVVGGVPKPARVVKRRWVITADRIALADEQGFLDREFRYTLDPIKTPKAIDLTPLDSGGTLRGIYRLDGDDLALSYGLERPMGFEHAFQLKQVDRSPRLPAARFELAPGCRWAIAPGGGWSSVGSNGIHAMKEEGADGSLTFILAHMRKAGPEPGPEVRPVVFDAQGKRHLPKVVEGGSNEGLAVPGATLHHRKYRLDPADLPADEAVDFGIEAVPSEVRRASKEAASAEAIARAKAQGIDLLPWPRVGEPCGFTLKTGDGRAVRSLDLKGKVVLIDCWATWCSPCMAKMPKLKEFYEKWRGEGFEIVGVSFDDDQEKARRVLETLALPWAQVFVPPNEATRSTWEAAAGIENLPRLLVIDRSGVLRYDGGPGEVEEQVARWLREPAPGK